MPQEMRACGMLKECRLGKGHRAWWGEDLSLERRRIEGKGEGVEADGPQL